MALTDFLLTLQGINGDSKEKLGAIDVQGWSYGVTAPSEVSGPMASGRRRHEPLVITKHIDKSSPVLHQFGVQNALISSAKLELHRMEGSTSKKYYEIELKDARVQAVHTRAAGANLPPVETVAFTFKKITWTFVNGGITANDDWNTNS